MNDTRTEKVPPLPGQQQHRAGGSEGRGAPDLGNPKAEEFNKGLFGTSFGDDPGRGSIHGKEQRGVPRTSDGVQRDQERQTGSDEQEGVELPLVSLSASEYFDILHELTNVGESLKTIAETLKEAYERAVQKGSAQQSGEETQRETRDRHETSQGKDPSGGSASDQGTGARNAVVDDPGDGR